MSIANALEDIVADAQHRGVLATARDLCRPHGPLATRRKTALFVANLVGHRVRVEDFAEQPFGLIAACERCGQLVKVPREPRRDGPGVEGRAVEFECPAAKP